MHGTDPRPTQGPSPITLGPSPITLGTSHVQPRDQAPSPWDQATSPWDRATSNPGTKPHHPGTEPRPTQGPSPITLGPTIITLGPNPITQGQPPSWNCDPRRGLENGARVPFPSVGSAPSRAPNRVFGPLVFTCTVWALHVCLLTFTNMAAGTLAARHVHPVHQKDDGRALYHPLHELTLETVTKEQPPTHSGSAYLPIVQNWGFHPREEVLDNGTEQRQVNRG